MPALPVKNPKSRSNTSDVYSMCVETSICNTDAGPRVLKKFRYEILPKTFCELSELRANCVEHEDAILGCFDTVTFRTRHT
jgi:hypothetical protein